METQKHDLLVIGAGPGGYVAAIRAAQLGQSVGIVEKEKSPGGTCLRVGCIPSKALLESSQKYFDAASNMKEHGIKIGQLKIDVKAMQKRKDDAVSMLTQGVSGLLKKNKIAYYTGTARFETAGKVLITGEAGETAVEAKNVLIATGSQSAPLPGVELDGKAVCTSTEALAFSAVPKHLVVIGAGYIGLELGSVWARLGAQVTVLEYLDRILPGMDSEFAREAKQVFEKQGIEFRLGTKVLSARAQGKGAVVEIEDGDPIECDKVLLAVGRIPNTAGLGLEEIGVKQDERGRVLVDENYRTNIEGVYAIGDCIPGPMLAHKASSEGVACVEKLFAGYGNLNYNTIAGVCYTHPEIASVGKTEDQLKEEGVSYKKGVFPFMASGRARATGEIAGRVKLLADSETDRVLGVHILGPHAGEMIHEAVAAIQFGASSEDIARTCHAHPTYSEALHEAALAVEKRTVHI